jgi:uncharacterized small protein (DUF1192 family)
MAYRPNARLNTKTCRVVTALLDKSNHAIGVRELSRRIGISHTYINRVKALFHMARHANNRKKYTPDSIEIALQLLEICGSRKQLLKAVSQANTRYKNNQKAMEAYVRHLQV